MKYRKKPVVIEAMRWEGDNLHDISRFCRGNAYIEATCDSGDALVIKTLEGKHIASIDDMIIEGIAGEFYPCKPDIFEQTYEEVEE
jgi:hypothetical protein